MKAGHRPPLSLYFELVEGDKELVLSAQYY